MTDRPELDRLKAQLRRTDEVREVGQTNKRKRKKKRLSRVINKLREENDAAVEDAARHNAISFSNDQRERVGEILEHTFDVKFDNSSPQNFLHQMQQDTHNRARISNARKCRLQAIQYILANFEWIASSGSDLRIHIRLLCEAAKVNPTPKLDLLSLVAKAAIDYSDGDDERDIRRTVSRDVRGMRWLQSQNVHAYDLIEFQAGHGGGVDSWSRAWAKARRRTKLGEVSACANSATGTRQTAVTNRDGGVAVSFSDTEIHGSESGKHVADNLERASLPAADNHSAPESHVRYSELRGVEFDERALNCIANGSAFDPGQGVLALIVKDESTSFGIRIMRSSSIKTLRTPFSDEAWAEVLAIATRVLGEQSASAPS